jgi:hypothetical protein
MLGRLIASQIVSASLASFLLLLTFFHADLTARFDLLQHRLQPAIARQTLPPDWLFMTIHALDLKHVLGQVDPNAHKLHVWIPSHG